MDENLLAGISHDKPVSLGSVEPFDAAAFGIGWGWLGYWVWGALFLCASFGRLGFAIFTNVGAFGALGSASLASRLVIAVLSASAFAIRVLS
jgi:hypothetical protein